MVPIISGDYAARVIPLLEQAKTSLDIFMYQWRWYSYIGGTPVQKVSLAIKSARLRGVPLRVILHAGSPSDHLARLNAQAAAQLKLWGADVKFYKSGGIMHAKMLLIDKTIAIIGSHNFSQRSMVSNIEIGVVVEGSGNIRKFQEYFDLIWGQI